MQQEVQAYGVTQATFHQTLLNQIAQRPTNTSANGTTTKDHTYDAGGTTAGTTQIHSS